MSCPPLSSPLPPDTNVRMAARRFSRPEEVLARLTKEPLAALYLFHGDEAYLIDRAVDLVRRSLPEAAVQTFYAGQDPVEALLEAWGASSLFAPQTLVILRSAEQLRDAERERLAREAELRNASQPLVVCAHGRLELTRKFFSRCAKTGFAAEFRRPFANQMPGWAQRLARERRLWLSDEAAQLLADLIGPDLLSLSTELDKVATFVFPDTDIDVQAVAICTGDVHQHSAFELADALGLRDRKKALGLLRRVLTDERQAVPILHALVGHFRRLWQLRDARDQGLPESHIERTLGLRGQRLRKLLNQSRLYSAPDLRRVLHRAAALDRRLKSARTSAGVLFDALVFDICTRPR